MDVSSKTLIDSGTKNNTQTYPGPGADDQSTQGARSVEAIVPLSDLQVPYWIHEQRSLTAGYTGGMVQAQFELQDLQSRDLLERAWLLIHTRFQSLRATVNVTSKQDLLLVIRKSSKANFLFEDWTSLSSELQQEKKESFLAYDRTQPLQLSKTPTSRFFCASLSDTTVWCVWSCHHMLFDGWSSAIVIKELVRTCNLLAESMPARFNNDHDYLDYLRCINQRPLEPSIEFWRENLSGFEHPTLLSTGDSQAQGVIRTERVVPVELASKIWQLCKRSSITQGTVLQAAWALVCAKYAGHSDIAFGLVTSGRNSDFEGIELVVGLLSNVIPLRVVVSSDKPVAEWLSVLQTAQFDVRHHEHLPLNQILSTGESAIHRRAFDSILAIDMPLDVQPASCSKPRVVACKSNKVSAFPLAMTVTPTEEISIALESDKSCISPLDATQLVESYAWFLRAFVDNWQETPANLLQRAPEKETAASLVETTPGIRNSELKSILPPENQLQLEVLAIWEEELQQYPLSTDANFFDAGGTSLAVLSLIERLKSEFGKPISLGQFIENPTVIDTCRQLSEGMDAEISSLVLLRETESKVDNNHGGKDQNVFCLHAGGGHALCYRPLSTKINSNFSVFGLQPKGIDGVSIPSDDVTEMVDQYIEEILAVQKEGPYHLICYCFGAALLVEMVRQLQSRGLQIGHLIVADAMSPIPADHPAASLGWNAYLVYEYMRQRRFDSVMSGVKSFVKTRQSGESVQDPFDGESRGHASLVQSACERAFKKYRAVPTDFHVHILHSTTPGHPRNAFLRNWQKVAPNHTFYELPYAHGDMLAEPYVAKTGDLINSIICKTSENIR